MRPPSSVFSSVFSTLPVAVLTVTMIVTMIVAVTIGLVPQSLACPRMPDESKQLSLEISPDVKREIYTAYYEDWSEEGGPGSCSAWVEISFSSFPSSRLATRPVDVASSLQEVVAEWGVESCSVHVQYDNDTGEEFAEHELCLTEDFAFGEDAFWSASYERHCWEPEEMFEEEESDEEIVEDLFLELEAEEIA